ncbi:MAG TPA: primosomal protein N' [Caulobacteraceae bacterium]|nr:primosomal protein N' [Caulobacteraceae bacterium]
MSRIAQVLLPLAVPEPFDYAVPDEMDLAVGDQVAVPLGPRTIRGVVAGIRDGAGHNRPLKAVCERLDDPPLPASAVEFVQWAARWTLTPPGDALAVALRGLRAPPPRPSKVLRPTGRAPARSTPARERVLAVAAAAAAASAAELARMAEVSAGVVKALMEEGALEVVAVEGPARFSEPDPDHLPADLNPSQRASAEALTGLIRKGGYQAVLLDGVTGSGKTEVYLEAAAALLRDELDAQVLVLLPEIALTQAIIARFERRFGSAPAEWHSAVPPPRRRLVWEGVASGEARIVVGARSALFLPFRKLRLVVVDEEHDGSFKQDEGFVYQARDLAVARASIEGATAVLASATPSLETVRNAELGRYHWLRLSARHGAAQLPDIELIDLRETPPEPGHWLARPLVDAMGETFARGEQTLLFLNRRGYAPLVICRSCGHRMTAPDTDSWLVEHRYTGRLVCHLTGFSMVKPDRCPSCGARDSLTAVGPGVERIEDEVRSLLPQARVAVFSSDTAPDGRSARALVEAMAAGEIDVMVATQAAAKGHNFPNLTLVGVVDADLGLRGGDLRAGERTFQLLAQATGRAGRAERPGRALIQTYAPEHPVMQALKHQDRDAFVAAEMAGREDARLPPFGRLCAIILSSENFPALEAYAKALAAVIPNAPNVEVYGPADAPLALVRGRRRKRLLVRADRTVDIQAYVSTWLARAKPPSSVRVTVDVDPYSFL